MAEIGRIMMDSKDRRRLATVSDAHALAQFLRVRRRAVQPADVGLPTNGRRRVAGLRRDEVARLAGISVAYYQRLEQGRDRHPSEPVIRGIARALQLDPDAARYLRDLAGRRESGQQRRHPERSPQLNPAVQQLIDSWPLTPALVYRSHTLTVAAANGLALALSPLFGPGHNSLRALFFEPEMREFFRNWDELAAHTVPYLRSLLGADRGDPELIDLIGELSVRSTQFRELWERHEVRRSPRGLMMINHPEVGPLDLHYQQLILPDTGHLLVPYWADSGSPSEAKLRTLARI
jgi:transcriptional regulator with XRE-family HTH domain